MVNERPQKMDYGDDARMELRNLHGTILGHKSLESEEKGKLIQATDKVIDAQREASGRELEAFEDADATLFRDKFEQEQRELRALIISLTEGIDAQLAVASDFGVITSEEFVELYGNIDALIPLEERSGHDTAQAEDWRRRKVREGYAPRNVRESAQYMAEGGSIEAYEPTAWQQTKDSVKKWADMLVLDPGIAGMATIFDSLVFGRVTRETARKQCVAAGLDGEDLEAAVDMAQEPLDVVISKKYPSLVSFTAFAALKVLTVGGSNAVGLRLVQILQKLLPREMALTISREVGEDAFEQDVLAEIERRIAQSIDSDRYGDNHIYQFVQAEKERKRGSL